MQILDTTIKEALGARVADLEKRLEADVAFYFGAIHPGVVRPFRDFIERLGATGGRRNRLACFVNTPGGSAATVEKLVEIIRFHYGEVWFVEITSERAKNEHHGRSATSSRDVRQESRARQRFA